MIKTKRNTVVFVMNNGVYGIEQMFTDPTPFKIHKSNFEPLKPFEAIGPREEEEEE